MHMKGTLVRQAGGSSYKLTEARLGGRLTRQDIHIVQVRVMHCMHVMHVVHVVHVRQMHGAACSRAVSFSRQRSELENQGLHLGCRCQPGATVSSLLSNPTGKCTS